jgi:hypothetical protein
MKQERTGKILIFEGNNIPHGYDEVIGIKKD